jgi:carnitine-CoA ligase
VTKAVYESIPLIFPDREQWNLSTILGQRARETPAKVFLTAGADREFSYGEIDEYASRIAGNLRGRGIEPGDRVVMLLDNCPEFILAWFGTTRAGAVEVPVNTQYFGEFLLHTIRSSGPTAVVVGANYAGRLVKLAPQLAEWSLKIFVAEEDLDAGAVESLRAAGLDAVAFSHLLLNDAVQVEEPTVPSSELTAILFTSGTTGPSKGVMLSHAQFYFIANACVQLVRLGPEDVYMTAMPLFHGNAQFLTVYPALIVGARVAIYRRFSPSRFSERLHESGATVTNFLGVMMDWVAKQDPHPLDSDNKLRVVHAGPTAWNAVPVLRERFGIEAFVEAFGQTEIGLPIMAPYEGERPRGSAGVGVEEWFDLRLADPDTDEPVPVGEIGELQVRAKANWTMTLGYYGLPEATAQAQRNLWHHTGDGMRMDENGFYYFVDRIKDCLRRRGENISSYEVEQPLLRHPDIETCVVVGMPADEEAGEDELALFVVPAESVELSPQRVIEIAQDVLPTYLIPRYVSIVTELPMTPNGKVRKAALRGAGTAQLWDRASADLNRAVPGRAGGARP